MQWSLGYLLNPDVHSHGTGKWPQTIFEHFLLGPGGCSSTMGQSVVPEAIFGDWHLQAGCFSSGAGPTGTTTTTPGNQSDAKANEDIHMQCARVVRCLHPIAFNPSPPPNGDIRSNKEQNINGKDGNSQDRPNGSMEVLKRKRLKSLVEPQ